MTPPIRFEMPSRGNARRIPEINQKIVIRSARTGLPTKPPAYDHRNALDVLAIRKEKYSFGEAKGILDCIRLRKGSTASVGDENN